MTPRMPESQSGVERRRYPRRNIIESQLLTADVALGHDGPGQQQRGIVIDLSEGGMAVQPFLPLSAGAVGEVRLELPGVAKTLSGRGIVAWVGSGGRAGIRFIDVPTEMQAQLRRWLLHPTLTEETAPEAAAAVPTNERESEELDFSAALRLIAERAQTITGASGVAVAIGDSSGMVCQASCGTAPDVGARLQPGEGLSGYCLSSGEVIYCTDTQSDLRVNAAAARQLGLGSIIIVPVFARGRLSGLLEVFAPKAGAFNPRQMTRLERFSELLGAAIEEHAQGRRFPSAWDDVTRPGNAVATEGTSYSAASETQDFVSPTPEIPAEPQAEFRSDGGHQGLPWIAGSQSSPKELAAPQTLDVESSKPVPKVAPAPAAPPVFLGEFVEPTVPAREGRALTLALIILLLLSALVAGWYVGRARATRFNGVAGSNPQQVSHASGAAPSARAQ